MPHLNYPKSLEEIPMRNLRPAPKTRTNRIQIDKIRQPKPRRNFDERFKIDSDLKKMNIPDGYYHSVITEVTSAEYKRIEGEYLKISFEITRGDFEGHKIWEMFQIWHPDSEQCVEFGKKKVLRLIYSATPREKIEYYTQLEGKRVGLEVEELYGEDIYAKPYEITDFLHPNSIKT